MDDRRFALCTLRKPPVNQPKDRQLICQSHRNQREKWTSLRIRGRARKHELPGAFVVP